MKVWGRPPKFTEPRHAVTMTLPERILDRLAEIDPDRTRAVVKVTEAVTGMDGGPFKPVQLVEIARIPLFGCAVMYYDILPFIAWIKRHRRLP